MQINDTSSITWFEKRFAEFQKKKYAITACNGTATLHTALKTLSYFRKVGRYVITTPLTMASTSFAIIQAGLIPVYADIDPSTLCITPTTVKKVIKEYDMCKGSIVAIMPVALYGLECDDFSDFGIPVVEDNAEAIQIPIHGDIASYSFQASKILSSGEGGCLVTDNDEYADYMRRFISLGYGSVDRNSSKIDKSQIQRYDYIRHRILGFNYRMPPSSAYILNEQFDSIGFLVMDRKLNAQKWEEICMHVDLPTQNTEGKFHDYWTYPVIVPDTHIWNKLYERCAQYGTNFYGAWALNYKEPPIKYALKDYVHDWVSKPKCPVAEAIHDRIIQLPTKGNRERDFNVFKIALEKIGLDNI